MLCAYIDNNDNIVKNMILADPTSFIPPEGFTVVGLPEGSLVTFDWKYDRDNHRFIDPNNIQIQEAVKL